MEVNVDIAEAIQVCRCIFRTLFTFDILHNYLDSNIVVKAISRTYKFSYSYRVNISHLHLLELLLFNMLFFVVVNSVKCMFCVAISTVM